MLEGPPEPALSSGRWCRPGDRLSCIPASREGRQWLFLNAKLLGESAGFKTNTCLTKMLWSPEKMAPPVQHILPGGGATGGFPASMVCAWDLVSLRVVRPAGLEHEEPPLCCCVLPGRLPPRPCHMLKVALPPPLGCDGQTCTHGLCPAGCVVWSWPRSSPTACLGDSLQRSSCQDEACPSLLVITLPASGVLRLRSPQPTKTVTWLWSMALLCRVLAVGRAGESPGFLGRRGGQALALALWVCDCAQERAACREQRPRLCPSLRRWADAEPSVLERVALSSPVQTPSLLLCVEGEAPQPCGLPAAASLQRPADTSSPDHW